MMAVEVAGERYLTIFFFTMHRQWEGYFLERCVWENRTAQTARREPEPVVPVQQLHLVPYHPREELRGELIVRAWPVELDEIRRMRLGGGGGEGGSSLCFCVVIYGGRRVWIQDVDEEVSVFYADHGFVCVWLFIVIVGKRRAYEGRGTGLMIRVE